MIIYSNDITNFAKKFLKYNSSDRSADLFVKDVGGNSKTTPWCSEFAKYVLKNSGHYDELASWYKNLSEAPDSGKNAAGCIQNAAKKAGAIVNSNEAQPGDIVLFKSNGGSDATHTGMVLKIENGVLYTIEGNVGGKVMSRTFKNADSNKFIYCKVTP